MEFFEEFWHSLVISEESPEGILQRIPEAIPTCFAQKQCHLGYSE